MILNLNFQFKNPDGTEVTGKEGHAGITLGAIMHKSNLGSGKIYDWGLQLTKAPHEITLDMTDKTMLLEWIDLLNTHEKSNLSLTNSIKWPIKNAIIEQWEKSQK